jgi:cyclase
MQAIKVYNMRGVDELIWVDIAATREERRPDFDLIDELADECFMPLTVGGGVSSLDDVRRLLQVGADKVALGTVAVERPELISEVASRFGSQCVVASIDAREKPSGYRVYTHSGTRPTELDAVEAATVAERAGAGEILVTSIERDGTMQGYDLALVRAISSAVRVPVLASGGAGSARDMVAAVADAGASAVCAASIFHFTEQTPLQCKHELRAAGIPVRI